MPLSLEVFAAFLAASVLLAITPGPTMSLVIANSTAFGVRAGLLTVAGNGVGLSILMAIVTLGLSSVMLLLAEWFDWVRFLGAAYLVWLGGNRLWTAFGPHSDLAMPAPKNASRWFWQGLAVALSNPKVLLFLGAFLPQFVDTGRPAVPQLVMLSVTFVATLAGVDAGYAALIGRARLMLKSRWQRTMDGASGLVLLLAAAWLAIQRRA
ncbi:MAG: LysE family translocator [Hyphomicrobiaceae bacterium]|nr:MAG: LysE family translocator [Hyphomicrobiaceae bacterium]